MSAYFEVEVLAPPDRRAEEWPADLFKLTRARRVLPRSLDPFQATADLNELANASLVMKLYSLPSLLSFVCRAFVMSLRADVICSHWLVPSGLIGSIASRILGKPHVAIEHSGALHLLAESWLGRGIARFISDGSDRVVVVSSELKRKLNKMSPGVGVKTEVIPMGCLAISGKGVPPCAPLLHEASTGVTRGAHGATALQAHTDSTRTVLFVGRLIEIKGVDLLLAAMKGMKDVQLIVAGDGELRRDLEARARELSVAARFVGKVGAPEREALLSSCDVVVIPSRVLAGGRSEGTPVICLEAMAAGRVVVAARTGGLPDVIVDDENGLLFEPGDHCSLREKLLLALKDEDLRRRISANARRSAQAYDSSLIGERFNQILTSALADNVRSPAFLRRNYEH